MVLEAGTSAPGADHWRSDWEDGGSLRGAAGPEDAAEERPARRRSRSWGDAALGEGEQACQQQQAQRSLLQKRSGSFSEGSFRKPAPAASDPHASAADIRQARNREGHRWISREIRKLYFEQPVAVVSPRQ